MSAPPVSRLRTLLDGNPSAPARDQRVKRRPAPGQDEVPDWRDSAACAHEDLNLFFPVSTVGAVARQQVEAAKAVCAGCPVRQDCLEWSLDVGPEFGIFGGCTEQERRRLRNERSSGPRWRSDVGPHRSETAVREAMEPF
jgi:WhiB family redox-sensing transcriptional regulator